MFPQIDQKIHASVERMRREAGARDKRMGQARKVRDGQLQELWPDQFSDKYPQSIVANFIDVVARDLAEVIAPLPTLACSSGAMKTDADKRRAERKNRIGEHYWRESQLEPQMFYGADQYLTYGFLPAWVEADYKRKRPMIHVEDPVGAYYRLDRWMNVVQYARVWRESVDDLCAEFPEYAHIIRQKQPGQSTVETELEVVRFMDDQIIALYLPERRNQVIAQVQHRLSKCPAVIAMRPGLHHDPRGQFDDVLWVQLARSVMAQLTLEAAHKAIQAPIAIPDSVQELPIGPDAVLQGPAQDLNAIHRIGLDVPNAAFALEQQLDDELKIGARYPDARLGVTDASVITGKGVQALMGGFDTQIKAAQTVLGRWLRDTTSLAFELDEKLWPNKVEKITGTLSGRSYELTYTPRTDIAGNYSCDVTYGFASGLSPQNALIAMLQARGDGLIDRDTVRRQLPWGLDADQVQRDLDVQETEDALKQGLFAALQVTGQMIAQGQADQAMMFFQAANDLIKGRQNGKPINDLLMTSFQTFIQQQQEQQQAAQAAQAQAPGGGGDGGDLGDGLPPGVAPGQAGLPPGGQPSVQSLIAGFNGSGSPSMTTSVRRRLPTG